MWLKAHKRIEVKNNNGTSVLIKPEERLIPGTKIQIDAAIKHAEWLRVKFLQVKPMKNADIEWRIGELILTHISVFQHIEVNIFISHAKKGGFE